MFYVVQFQHIYLVQSLNSKFITVQEALSMVWISVQIDGSDRRPLDLIELTGVYKYLLFLFVLLSFSGILALSVVNLLVIASLLA